MIEKKSQDPALIFLLSIPIQGLRFHWGKVIKLKNLMEFPALELTTPRNKLLRNDPNQPR